MKRDVSALIRQCQRMGRFDDAIEYAEALECSTTPLSSTLITSIIRLYGESGQLGRALAMLSKMGEHNVAPNVHHFGALLQAARRAKQCDLALGLFDLMERKYGIRRNVVVYNTMIATAGEAQKLDLVLELLRKMEQEGIERDAFTYSAAIGACERKGQWQFAVDLYQDMVATCAGGTLGARIKPNVILLNNVLNACATGRQWKLALRLLVESRALGVAPDAISYSSVIIACGYAKECGTAKRIFDSIQGAVRDAGTYNAMLTAYERSGEWNEALALFRQMNDSSCLPDSKSYNIVIAACGQARQWQECLDLYADMQTKGVPRDAVIYNTVIAALQNAGQWSQARELLQTEAERGVPNCRLPQLLTAAEIFESAQEVYTQGFLEGKIQHWASPLKDTTTAPLSSSLDVEASSVSSSGLLYNISVGAEVGPDNATIRYRYMDLHKFPVSVAKTALDFVLNEMSGDKCFFDLRIITGRGNHVNSQGTRGVLRAEVEEYLRGLMPVGVLQIEETPGNDGCIVVKCESIKLWLDKRRGA